MIDLLRLSRIYDTRSLPTPVLYNVVMVADRVALSLCRKTTRTLRWWPFSKLPPKDEAFAVARACDSAAAVEDFGAEERAVLRVLVFHQLYGSPIAQQLDALVPQGPLAARRESQHLGGNVTALHPSYAA